MRGVVVCRAEKSHAPVSNAARNDANANPTPTPAAPLAPAADLATGPLPQLRRDLQQAISEERFEDAIALREQIAKLTETN